MCMRNELLPDGDIQHSKNMKRPSYFDADGVLMKDNHHTQHNANMGHHKHSKKRAKCPSSEMKYNKFQMYDLKEGTTTTATSTTTPSATTSHCSSPQLVNHKHNITATTTGNNISDAAAPSAAATMATVTSGNGGESPLHFYHQQQQQQKAHPKTPPPQPKQQQQHSHTHPHHHCHHHHQQSMEGDVKDIRRYLRQLLGRIHQKEDRAKIALEWKIVALVLDRLFFFCYLAAIVISLATIFPKTY